MKSLMDTVKDYLTPDVMKQISSVAGETPENTKRAMESIVPTLLSGAAKLAESPGGDNQLINLINKQTSDGNILNNLGDQLSGGNATQRFMSSGGNIIKALFGGKLNSVIDTLASSVGIKGSAISSLLSIAAPLVLGVLGKERSARGLGATGVASLLAGEKSFLSQMIPAGLGSVLGWNDGGRTEQRVAEPPRYEARAGYEQSTERRSDWWPLPVLGLAALGLLLYFFWPGRDLMPEETVAKQEVRPESPVRQDSTPAVQGPKPIEKEALPIPEQPRAARPDATISQSSKDSSASGNQIARAERGAATPRSRAAISGDASKGGLDVRQVQESLKNQGQNPGPIDGIMGPQTRQALRQFQKTNGLPQTGSLDVETQQKLNIDNVSSGSSVPSGRGQ